MVDLVFSPGWFYGKDIIIDAVSIVVLTLLSYFTFRCYRSTKKKEHLWFSIAMGLLSLSFLFKILTNFTLYQHVLATRNLGLFTITYHTVVENEALEIIGTMVYRLLSLLGLYTLFSLYYKQQDRASIILIIYFIIITTYFTSAAYYVFHITSLLLLVFILLHYHHNYCHTKDRFAKLVYISFGIIALSQLIFIFLRINLFLYPIAETIQLIGYLLLLLSFILVRSHGRKKNTN